jgi:hypothetical protein
MQKHSSVGRLRFRCGFALTDQPEWSHAHIIGTTAALIGAGIAAAAGGVASAAIGSNAATSAANTQSQSAQEALDFQKQMWAQQQANMGPYVSAGQTSIGNLMNSINGGTFGPGSLPSPPTFTAPTLEDARNSPGYQFTAQQGSKGILQGSAAAGGAISGGTLKALDTFNTGLADTTYNDVFSRAMQTYNAGLQGYQTNLQKQQQEFNQMYMPAQLGENAIAGLNTTGSGVANSVGNLMTQQGNAQASGIVGSANAVNSGIGTAANNLSQLMLYGSMTGGGGSVNPGGYQLPPGAINNLGPLVAPVTYGLGPG